MAAKTGRQPSNTPIVPTTKVIPTHLQVAMLLAVVGGLLFIKPLLGTVLLSILIAYIFYPVYRSTLNKTNKPWLAQFAALGVVLLSFILPLMLIVSVTVDQANSLVTKFRESNLEIGSAQIEETLEKGTERVNGLLSAVPGGEELKIDKEEVVETIKSVAADLTKGLVNFVKSAGGAFFGFISTSILGIFLIFGMWRHQAEIVAFIKRASPFEGRVTSHYLERAGTMTKAMVVGQLVVATVQGFASAASLWLVGIDYFWFFFMLLTFLSFIPLGGGILTIPIGIIIMFTDVWRGIFVLVWHFLIVTNIDNILRPRLVPKHVRIDPALILLAVFSGLALFGPTGVVFGPVIMILIITTFQMYADYADARKKALKAN